MYQVPGAGELAIGGQFEAFEVLVPAESYQQYLHAEEDFDPRYWQSYGDKAPLAHPALLLHVDRR